MIRMVQSLALLAALLITSVANAANPLGGLAVAVSPDGKTLIAAGDSRTLYVLDAAKMEVINRVWLGVCIVDLQFNQDASLAIAEDSDGTLFLIDAKTWSVSKQVPKAQQMSVIASAGVLAGLNPDYSGHVIRFFAVNDLSEKGKISFPKEQKVIALGLDAAGARLGVLMDSVNDSSEPKATATPPELKGIAADEFRTNNDGKTSLFMLFKVPTGEKIGEFKLNYTPSSNGAKILFQGDDAIVLNYTNLNGRIDKAGKVTVFNLKNSFNYGIGWSVDQKIIVSGGLSLAAYTKVDGMSATEVQPDRLPGWPEYFKSFAVAPDGTAYGATSGYRIIKIKPGGAFDKSYPVF